MNRKLRDRCLACDRNGLIEEKNSVRKRCMFCHQGHLRPCDRMLYTVCRGEAHYVDGKGWYLPGWRPVTEPTFGKKVAQRQLAELVAVAASAKLYAHIKSPFTTENLTIQGRDGTVVYTNSGPEFCFLSEQVVDCSEILQQDKE